MSIKAQHIKLLAFLFIVIITVYQHVSSIDKSMQNRDNIWEPDDNYHELIKASNSKNCIEENNDIISSSSALIDEKSIENLVSSTASSSGGVS